MTINGNVTVMGDVIEAGGQKSVTYNIEHVEHLHHGDEEQAKNETDKRKSAIECVEARIKEEIAKPNRNWRKVLTPLVAAIRINIVPNNMNHEEFNQKYGTDIVQSTYSRYVPKDIKRSEIAEPESQPFEEEFSMLLK